MLSRGLFDGLRTVVGCSNRSGLFRGKVTVDTPQSLVGTVTWVASVHRQKEIVIWSFVSTITE